MDEIQEDIKKSRLTVWTCDMDERREDKCYTQKWKENEQDKDPEPDGCTKLEKI